MNIKIANKKKHYANFKNLITDLKSARKKKKNTLLPDTLFFSKMNIGKLHCGLCVDDLKIVYPSLNTHTGQADNIIGTLDDMILDNQPKYLMLRESIRSRAKATIKHASWHHTSKKNAQVDSSAFKPSKPNRPRSDSDYSSPQKEKKRKKKIKEKLNCQP